MKRVFTPYLFFAFCFLVSAISTTAQNFLWGRSGGSVEPGNGPELETIRDLATDRNGNVYILTHVKKQGMNIAGQPISGYGGIDVVLASFKPDGSLRWKKLIGNGDDEHAYWLGTDAKDGVYFSADVSQDDWPALIDTDAQTITSYQRFILVKYDTSGNYKWHRQPEADTLSTTTTWNYNRSLAMDVDDAGNTYWLMQLYTGAYGQGGLIVPTLSHYILKYSSIGGFSFIKPNFEISGTGNTIYMKVDEANGRIYLSGSVGTSGSISMGGNPVTGSMYVGCYKMDGSLSWIKTNTSGRGGFSSRAAIDDAGNIYLTGYGNANKSTTPPVPATNFNGYTVTNGDGRSTPFVVKMDKAGNNLWARAADVVNTCGALAVAVRNTKELVIAGRFVTNLTWSGYPYPGFSNSDNYDVFITRFDVTNGYVLGMDKITSTTANSDDVTCMVSDGKGNVYIGGDFGGDMLVNANDKLQSTGGDTDWFLVKYGDMWPAAVASTETNKVKVYPNPAREQLIVEGAAGCKISISNMLGQEVYGGNVNTHREIVNIEHLPSGNYMLQIIGADGSRNTMKAVKQ